MKDKAKEKKEKEQNRESLAADPYCVFIYISRVCASFAFILFDARETV